MAFQRVDQEELTHLQEPSEISDAEDPRSARSRLEFSGAPEQRRAAAKSTFQVVVGMFAFGAVLVFATRAGTKIEHADAEPARLLQSDEVLDVLVDHAVRFHSKHGGEDVEASGNVNRGALKAAAHQEVQDILTAVAKENEGAGRSLSSLKLNSKQWTQTKQVLEALHDKRVHEMGDFVRQEVGQSKDPAEATARVAAREKSIRELREALIPKDFIVPKMMHDEKSDWGLDVQDGGFEAAGTVNGWHGSLEIGGASSEQSRRLLSKGEVLYVWLTGVAAVLVGIATMIMTILFHGALAENMWLISAGAAGLLCGGTGFIGASPGLVGATQHTIAGGLWGIIGAAIGGLKGHLPQMDPRSAAFQIPCYIMTSFTGLEAIWVFGPKPAATPAAPPTAAPR